MTDLRNQIKSPEQSAAKAFADLHTLQARIAELRVCRSGCLGFTGADLDQYAKLERSEKARLVARRILFRKLAQILN